MSPIGNGHDHQITVGLDIGSSTITCAIGQIIPAAKRIKLLGISSISTTGIRRGVIINRDELIKKLQPLGLASASRTGVVAMTKGSEIYKQN